MSSNNMQTSKEIYMEYQKVIDRLINTYCQLKNNHPYDNFPLLTNKIWQYQALGFVWFELHKKLNGQTK